MLSDVKPPVQCLKHFHPILKQTRLSLVIIKHKCDTNSRAPTYKMTENLPNKGKTYRKTKATGTNRERFGFRLDLLFQGGLCFTASTTQQHTDINKTYNFHAYIHTPSSI